MLSTDDGVFAVAATCALQVVTDTQIVIGRTPCVTVAANGCAIRQRAHHVAVTFEDRNCFAATPGHDVGAVTSGQS